MQHSKLGPPPQLKVRTLLMVLCAYDLATGRYVFMEYRTSHPAHCYWLGATPHCPKVDAQKYPKHSRNKKIQAEGRVSLLYNDFLPEALAKLRL